MCVKREWEEDRRERCRINVTTWSRNEDTYHFLFNKLPDQVEVLLYETRARCGEAIRQKVAHLLHCRLHLLLHTHTSAAGNRQSRF